MLPGVVFLCVESGWRGFVGNIMNNIWNRNGSEAVLGQNRSTGPRIEIWPLPPVFS